jgi:class 3 adenylate cyclase/tetratricopeptide (TPR) repeat protein
MESSVSKWLGQIGLGVYADILAENDVDMRALPLLSEADLRELGVSLGHRKILMAAITDVGSTVQPQTTILAKPSEPDPTPEVAPTDDAEHRLLTVLFADIVGSTELSQQLEPEQMREALRSFQDAVNRVVSRYGGYVAKYLGDGALTYFGWPTAYEDHASRAVHAGLEIIAALKEIRPNGKALSGRVGIATGRVVVGDLVSSGGTETGAIAGDTPNLAARLQAVAQPGDVVIGPTTRRLCGKEFILETLGATRLKGYENEVEPHRVVAPSTVENRFSAQRLSGLARLVGRVGERQILLDRWQSALQDRGQVVMISGDAGIGKSRLVEALMSEVNHTPHELVRMQCSPYHSTSAFHPIAERILRSSGIRPEDTADIRATKIKAMLETTPQKVPRAAEVYAELLSIGHKENTEIGTLTPQNLKDLTIQTIVERMAAMASQKPVLMVLEDSHWIDPSSQEVLERLTLRIADLPVLLLVTQRPEGASDWALDYDNATLLPLGLLTRDQTTEMVASILGQAPDSAFVDDIEKRAGGVPLFVEELARSFAERSEGDGEVTIPETLQGSLMARLDRLSRGARNVALVASVIGRDFDASLLAAVLGSDGDELDVFLSELASARILVASGSVPGARMFRHALIQDTAYQSLLSRTRRAHHLSIAHHLETGLGDAIDREPEVIARHFSEAAHPREAIKYWTKAAERALARSADFEAVEHAKAAYANADQLEDTAAITSAKIATGVLLGRAFESSGEIYEACKVLKTTVDLAKVFGNNEWFADAAVYFSNALFLSSSSVSPSIALLEEALSATPADNEKQRCKILSSLARGSVMQGDGRKGSRYRAEALTLVRKLDDKASLCSLYFSELLTPAGVREAVELGSWRTKLNEMLDVAKQLDDSHQARARALEVFVSAEMGDRDRMDQGLNQMAHFGKDRQHMHFEVIVSHGMAMKAILDGDFQSAENFTNAAADLGQKTYGGSTEGVHGMQMFTIRREQGRLAQIAPVIKKMLDDNPSDAAWKPGFAIVASDLGHVDAARQMLREMAEDDFSFALDAKYSTTLAYLAEVAAISDDKGLSERLYDLLHPYEEMTITAGVMTVCLGAAARQLGMLSTAVGEWDRAERHFEAALDLNQRMRTLPWVAWTKHDLAAMLLKRGRPADRQRALSTLHEALDVASEFGMLRLAKSSKNLLGFDA